MMQPNSSIQDVKSKKINMWLINGSGNQQSHRTINLMEAIEEMKCTDLPPMVIEHNGRFDAGGHFTAWRREHELHEPPPCVLKAITVWKKQHEKHRSK
mmetsp:Transcript_20560/g.30628  ORF Transcript_20560/g.30628 Transcript_20560/m.30628 type:complete len:98 (+) Transcript_20560:144-437(+)